MNGDYPGGPDMPICAKCGCRPSGSLDFGPCCSCKNLDFISRREWREMKEKKAR